MFFSTIIGVLFFFKNTKDKEEKEEKKIISYESLAMPTEGHELHKK